MLFTNAKNNFVCSSKYTISESRDDEVPYRTKVSVTINDFRPQDEGSYICISTNSLGKIQGTVRLYGTK